MKHILLHDSVFQFGWCLIVGGTEEQATNLLEKKYGFYFGGEKPNKFSGFFTFKNSNRRQCALWVLNKKRLDTMVHEATHAAIYVAEQLNLDVNHSNEVVSYYAEYLVKELRKIK
jgi:hypothetical protein